MNSAAHTDSLYEGDSGLRELHERRLGLEIGLSVGAIGRLEAGDIRTGAEVGARPPHDEHPDIRIARKPAAVLAD